MEIVVNDTNILIDLYNAGLLKYCQLLNLDVSVMVYAKEHNCRLLTGDKTLRTAAENDNIIVSGHRFING